MGVKRTRRGAKPLQTGALAVRQRCIKEGRASGAQGGSVQRRKRQAPATAATHCHPKRLSGPSSGGAVPPELARRDLPSTLSSVLRDGKGLRSMGSREKDP